MNYFKNVTDAVEAMVELCYERKQPARKVVDEVVQRVVEPAATELMRIGLLARTHNQLHVDRRGGEGVEIRPEIEKTVGAPPRHTSQTGYPHPKEVLTRIRLETQDERFVSFIDMSLDDIRWNKERFRRSEHGFKVKADVLEETEAALVKHGAEYVSDLPADTKAEIESHAQEAWHE